MISFFGVLRHTWKDLINDRHFSLYRFTEYLVELALLRREGYRRILEVGPGSDPFVAQIPAEQQVDRILAIDYCHEVIEQNKRSFDDDRIEFVFMRREFQLPGRLGNNLLGIVAGVASHAVNDEDRHHIAPLDGSCDSRERIALDFQDIKRVTSRSGGHEDEGHEDNEPCHD